jgi:hypothetical protein
MLRVDALVERAVACPTKRYQSLNYNPAQSQVWPLMSALGHKQTFETAPAMSALPPKADIFRGGSDVR